MPDRRPNGGNLDETLPTTFFRAVSFLMAGAFLAVTFLVAGVAGWVRRPTGVGRPVGRRGNPRFDCAFALAWRRSLTAGTPRGQGGSTEE